MSVFFAGLAFSRIVKPRVQATTERTQEAARTLLEFPVFALFGLDAPLTERMRPGPAALVFILRVLFLQRTP